LGKFDDGQIEISKVGNPLNTMLKDPINIGRADVNSYGYRDSKEQEADRYQIPLGYVGRRNVRKNARTREDAEFAAN
jgi:hypothetical protein